MLICTLLEKLGRQVVLVYKIDLLNPKQYEEDLEVPTPQWIGSIFFKVYPEISLTLSCCLMRLFVL
jgi:hypothetical protein